MNAHSLSPGIRIATVRPDAGSATGVDRLGSAHGNGRSRVIARLCLLAALASLSACSAPPGAPQAAPAGSGVFSLAPPESPRPPGNPALDGVVTSSGTNQIIPPGR